MNDVLNAVEQKVVPFYDDQLIAVRGDDGKVYVSIRHVCDALGVDRRGQMRKIRDHAVLTAGLTRGGVKSPPSPDGHGGGVQESALLRLDLLPFWLAGISPNRVKGDIQEKLLQFQREAADVLWQAFGQDSGVAVRPDDELMQSSEPSAIAFRNALAVAKMARQQYYLEKEVKAQGVRIDGLDERLALIEANMSDPKAYVTQEQAQLVSEGVKVIAGVLSKRSGSNEYGGTYVELYRRFGVTSYKHIPAGRFDETMNWLRSWYSELTDESDAPF